MSASLGAQVKSARVGAGLSPEALAVELGVSAATVFRIERGDSDVSVKRLQKIAEATQKPLGYFLGSAA